MHLTAKVVLTPSADEDQWKVAIRFFAGRENPHVVATHGVAVFERAGAEREAEKARNALRTLGIHEPN